MGNAANRRTIALLSPDYLQASFPRAEWATALRRDPEGVKRHLVPIRVRECEPEGLLGQIVHLDLVGLPENEARSRLLKGLKARLKPSSPPRFSGAAPTVDEPAYPGTTTDSSTGATPVDGLAAVDFGSGAASLAAVPVEVNRVAHGQAQEHARALARGERREGYFGHGSQARLALVPLLESKLLNALTLDDELGETVASLARAARLVPQSVGIEPRVTGRGVTLGRANTGHVGQQGFAVVGTDGAVACEIDVGGDGQLAGTRVDSVLLTRGIENVGRFAQDVWEKIDPRAEVHQVAVALAIFDPQHKVFDLVPDARSYSMSSSMSAELIVPEPALVVERAEVTNRQFVKRLVAEVRRAFADAGAVPG